MQKAKDEKTPLNPSLQPPKHSLAKNGIFGATAGFGIGFTAGTHLAGYVTLRTFGNDNGDIPQETEDRLLMLNLVLSYGLGGVGMIAGGILLMCKASLDNKEIEEYCNSINNKYGMN